METTDYVTYDLAVKLKAAGFDWPCSHYYSREDAPDRTVWLTSSANGSPHNYNQTREWNPPQPLCSAPSSWQAQKWLREKCGMHVYPTLESVNEGVYDCKVVYLQKGAFRFNKRYTTYEQALSAGIAAALELINY